RRCFCGESAGASILNVSIFRRAPCSHPVCPSLGVASNFLPVQAIDRIIVANLAPCACRKILIEGGERACGVFGIIPNCSTTTVLWGGSSPWSILGPTCMTHNLIGALCLSRAQIKKWPGQNDSICQPALTQDLLTMFVNQVSPTHGVKIFTPDTDFVGVDLVMPHHSQNSCNTI
ncbi:hypothetical protein RRG08_017923, partial [Elysia crispata]